MFSIVLALIFMMIAVVITLIPSRVLADSKLLKFVVQSVCVLLAVFFILSTSFVIIDSNKVGHLKRVYGGKSMPAGAVVAVNGEKGPQAEILAPGFHFRLLLNVLYNVSEEDVITIPPGYYGEITAKDGAPLTDNAVIALPWVKEEFKDMLDANYFLTGTLDGSGERGSKGQKGVQHAVLTPGTYRLNTYLFDVKTGPEHGDSMKMTAINVGEVGVVKSNIQEVPYVQEDVDALIATLSDDQRESLANPLVPKGYLGVWAEALPPGEYPLNKRAYHVTHIDTRVQRFSYQGGYTRRIIDLEFDAKGAIKQIPKEIEIPQPPDAADSAIILRLEGWEVPQEARVQVQVTPQKAPFVVASVGTLDDVENKIVTPEFRSILRNVTGDKLPETYTDDNGVERTRLVDRPVLSLINDRSSIESETEAALVPIGQTTGVEIKSVLLGDPGIPPELLVASRREQIAGQFVKTFQEEQKAQTQRIETEKQRATADQQDTLVAAQIAEQAAEHEKNQKQLQGEGEKLMLTAIAEGQRAQVEVLGEEKVFQLSMFEKAMDALVKNPDLVKFNVPEVLIVGGGSGSLESAASVFGKLMKDIGGVPVAESSSN